MAGYKRLSKARLCPFHYTTQRRGFAHTQLLNPPTATTTSPSSTTTLRRFAPHSLHHHQDRGVNDHHTRALFTVAFRNTLHSTAAAAAMADQTIDVRSLVAGKDGEVPSKVADILDSALNNRTASASAETTASDIDKLYQPGGDAENFLWELWTFYLQAVQKVPAGDERQQLLVTALEKLKAKSRENVEIWGSTTSVWADLPMLNSCMRDAWNGRPESDEKIPETASSWIALNSFAAHTHGSSTTDWSTYAIWELRDSLEEAPASPKLRDVGLATAYEWIIHAGKVLYGAARKGAAAVDEQEARSLRGGKLFEGKQPGLSQERWQFWRARLEQLGAEVESGDLKQKVDKAVEVMKDLEAAS